MSVLNVSTKATGVDRRLQAVGIGVETAAVLVGCLVIVLADTQGLTIIPLVADLQKTYGLTTAQASWTLSAPALVSAGLAPILVRLGDRVGMRNMLLASLVATMVANLLCSVAQSFALLVVARALVGVGAAATPLGYAILRARGTNERRTTRGMATITVAAGVGVAVAYLLGGFIVEAHGSVRTVFWVLTAFSALALLAAWLILPDGHGRPAEPIDWIGAAGLSIGLVGVVLALTEGNTWGWSSARILTALIGGAVALGLWTLYEITQGYPLVNVRRLLNRTAAPTLFISTALGCLLALVNLVQVTYLEMPKQTGYGLGLSVLHTAYIVCVNSGAVMLGGTIGMLVVHRVGPRLVMVTSTAFFSANFLWIAYNHTEIWQYIVFNAVWGVTFALANSASYAAFFQDADPSESAMYASANLIAAAAGAGIAPAIFVALLTSRTIANTPIPDPVVFKDVWIYAAVASVVLIPLALLVRRTSFTSAAEPAEAVQFGS
ncbi:MFS transporter [Streptomyces sp. NPDC004237]|uniref:MFS transporter n=1 Tax=Streptomyces sp. NPDC004237 TaxID=3154455 RepID=UPI0033BAF4D0